MANNSPYLPFWKLVDETQILKPLEPIMGCFSFGPEHIQSQDIWSPSIGPQEQTVPAHLVPETIGPPGQLVPKHSVPMDKWSPQIWSPWKNGPQPIQSP